MRLTEFMIVIIAALMFLIPSMKKDSGPMEMQEEVNQEVIEDDQNINTFKIRFEVTDPSEESVADIIWIKKAAQVAKDAGVPYFNIKGQTLTKRFRKEFKQNLSVIEGIIELDNDPMKAEYDAQEIETLELSEFE